MPPKNMITISQERYSELIQGERLLEALMDTGVDSWDGYEEAQNLVYRQEAPVDE